VTPLPVSTLNVEADDLRGISLQVWHAFTGPEAKAFEDQVAGFNTLNEWGITVYATAQGDYKGLFESVNAALETGQYPDILVTLPEQILAWKASGAVVNLTPYASDPVWGLAGSEAADIPVVFWEQDEVKGRRLGVPAARSSRFLFYNVTWGGELGFDHPPENAEQFRQQACAANAAFRADSRPANDGYGGWIVDSDWMTVYPWLLAFGGGVIGNNSYQFETDANRSALEFLKGLMDDACAWVPFPELTPQDAFTRRLALFITGDLTDAPLLSNTMSRSGNPDEWTVLPFPGPNDGALAAYGPSYMVLRSTAERQLAAWLFARWTLSPESQAKWVETTGLLPLRSSALPLLTLYRAAHPQWDAAAGFIPEMRGVPQLASWRTVRYVLADGVKHIFRVDLPLEQIPAVLAEMQATAEEFTK
jgi:ABC-type glycerol-3-phosphate transport system substrate-binding protein